MGKNQITTKNTTQSQGVCEKIFRAVTTSPAFRSFQRISTVHPQTHNPKSDANSATKPIVASTDHHRTDPAKATKFKLVAQSGSTIPLELNGQQIPSQEKYQNLSSASNMVLVEYNHNSEDSATPKFKAEPLKSVNKFHANIIAARDHRQNQDPYKGTKVEPVINKSPVKNMVSSTILHHQINEGPKDDNDRFSNYIDHVKKKMRSMSSFDDD